MDLLININTKKYLTILSVFMALNLAIAETSHAASESRISPQTIAMTFHLSLEDAAKTLDICPAHLKRLNRRYDFPKWPYRAAKAIESLLDNGEKITGRKKALIVKLLRFEHKIKHDLQIQQTSLDYLFERLHRLPGHAERPIVIEQGEAPKNSYLVQPIPVSAQVDPVTQDQLRTLQNFVLEQQRQLALQQQAIQQQYMQQLALQQQAMQQLALQQQAMQQLALQQQAMQRQPLPDLLAYGNWLEQQQQYPR